MLHTESSIIVYFTSEYARFKMINGNRQLNEGKINRIIKEIVNGNDMLRYYPIQVKEKNGRLEILDGQHRFYICKKMKRCVHYLLVAEDKTMPDIAKINSNVEKWKPLDFLNCYIQQGNDHYKIVQQFLDKYKISLAVSLLLLSRGDPETEGGHPEVGQNFKNGTFEVKRLQHAEDIATTCLLFSGFNKWRTRAFIIAIAKIKIASLITIDDLLTAYNRRPEMLKEQLTYKNYINVLEQIVNVGKQKRILIL